MMTSESQASRPGPWQDPVTADEVARLATAYPRLTRVRTVGRTLERRPILAVTVTDPAAPAHDKQHVLVTAGQHGDEPGSRLVALAFLRWLLSPQAALTRRRQVVVVMPDVNPDGAAAGLHATPQGIQPNLDHGPNGARTPEGRAVETVAERLQPDLYVDLHARSRAGCSHDMVLFPAPRIYCEDEHWLHTIAEDMARAGEREGVPHVVHPLTWWTPDPDEPSTTRWCYRRFKSLVLLTETAESPAYRYDRKRMEAAGVARLRALLEWGNRRHPKLPFPGYPNALVLGFFVCGVLAVGRTAAARRRSRVALWQEAAGFEQVRLRIPEMPLHKEMEVVYRGRPLPAAGFVLAAAGRRRLVSVTWDRQRVPLRACRVWHTPAATHVAFAVRALRKGRHVAEVDFR